MLKKRLVTRGDIMAGSLSLINTWTGEDDSSSQALFEKPSAVYTQAANTNMRESIIIDRALASHDLNYREVIHVDPPTTSISNTSHLPERRLQSRFMSSGLGW